jgi:hypothetical protein
MKSRKGLTVLVLVGLALLGLAGPLSSAVGFFSHGLLLEIHGKSGTLVSRGAAVKVSVKATCTSNRAYVTVQITQRVGNGIASGFAQQDIACAGEPQRLTMTVPANGKAFKKGAAAIRATIEGCGFGVCGSEENTTTIDLSNK